MKLKSFSEICPNCVTNLVFQQKKFGGFTNWFVCTDCGYRERPYNEGITSEISQKYVETWKFKNSKQVER